jgi:hypothetical protein
MKKILSIDGGGVRGLIPALILAEIEKKTGKSIATMFDLIAGTSTGGIIALGLACNDGHGAPKFSAADMVDFYTRYSNDIFSSSVWKKLRSAGGLIDEKYTYETLERLLKTYLGDATLGTALTKVLISSYNLEHRSPFFFKSWRDESRNIPMWKAGRATSAAPTFFEPAVVSAPVDPPLASPEGSTLEQGEFALIDGAVFINNPAVSAYAEARRVFTDDHDFLVVSLGTGEMTNPILYKDAKDWGKAEWALPILSVVFDGVADAVNYQMRQILNREDTQRFFRFQTRLDRASDDIDDASPANITAMKQEAEQILMLQKDDLEQICAQLP